MSERPGEKQLISRDCRTGRCSAVKRLRNVSMSPLNRSLPACQPRSSPTENLHRLQAVEAALRQQRGHVVHPGETAARSVRQKRLGVETGLVLDEQLKLLVLDGLRYEESAANLAYSRTCSRRGSESRSCSGTACPRHGCA